MNVFVAGATGALGAQLVPQLVARGHQVVGMTHSADNQDAVRQLGARPVLADALDAESVSRAVSEAEPDVIVHEIRGASNAKARRELHWEPHYPSWRRGCAEGLA